MPPRTRTLAYLISIHFLELVADLLETQISLLQCSVGGIGVYVLPLNDEHLTGGIIDIQLEPLDNFFNRLAFLLMVLLFLENVASVQETLLDVSEVRGLFLNTVVIGILGLPIDLCSAAMEEVEVVALLSDRVPEQPRRQMKK